MIPSAAAMLNLFNGLWLDSELYNFHRWFDMIYILIMHLRGASFILWLKSRVSLRSEGGMIMVSICLHGVISWSQASGRGRFGSTKTVIDEKYHPPVFEFIRLRQYIIFQTNDQVLWRCLFIWACEGHQFVELYISMFEKWLESPQWLLAVSKPKVRMRVTSAWGQE